MLCSIEREEANQGAVGKHNSKEMSMLDLNTSKNENKEMVSLESLSDLTGFPVEMIKKELFSSDLIDEKISLSELRKAMMSYIDETMLSESKK